MDAALAPLLAVVPEHYLKLAMAVIVGGLIGAEREYRDKSAGFRTLIFICVGSTLFTLLSLSIGITRDQARIAAQIVSGIGFLGGGAILRDGSSIKGLTTAATIWITAALGMGVGAGAYALTTAAAAAILTVLWCFPLVERFIDHLNEQRVYQLVCVGAGCVDEVEDAFRGAGLKLLSSKREKRGKEVLCTWYIAGKPSKHATAIDELMANDSVRELSY